MTETERVDLIAAYRDAAAGSRAAADMAREIAADKPQHAERWLAEAEYREALAARADASAAALTAATTPSPKAPPHDVIAAALADNLRLVHGLDVDYLGDGVIDCGAAAEPGAEVLIVVDPDTREACVSTVYYEVDEDDTHPVEDLEHGTFAPAWERHSIALAVRRAKGDA